mgnify:CR=1 FL=1
MYLFSKLIKSHSDINVAIIGCGKFISMFLSQSQYLKNIVINTIVDINIKKAKSNCFNSCLEKNVFSSTVFSEDINAIIKNKNIDIVIEATGNAKAGILNASKIIKSNKHIIMVNVEADTVAGKYLSDLAKKYNVVYSMAYGDQPSLILEQIEWGLINGFDVISAGKGTKYHPSYKYSTPETVWKYYGIKKKTALSAGMNPKMFNSFITGDKSSIEMVAVVNASHLNFPENGLKYCTVAIDAIPKTLIPKKNGGILEKPYQVEVISSINSNKETIKDNLRWGVFVVIEARNQYVKDCFSQYGITTDSSGRYSALWRPYHYIGLELGQSIYSIALNKQPTGHTKFYKADVATIAKKNLKKGEKLDGEGGFTVRGEGITAELSKKKNILPLGLSDGLIVKKNIKKNDLITLDMVDANFPEEIRIARDYQYSLIQ